MSVLKSLVPSFLLVLAVSAHSPRHSFSLKRAPAVEQRALPSGWAALGCYTDSTSARTLADYYTTDWSGMTTDKCASTCSSLGFAFAGTEYYGECFCGNSIASTGIAVDSSECNTPCAGNGNEFCGGGNRLSVYGAGPSDPTTLPDGWAQDQACIEDSDNRLLPSFHITSNSLTPASCVNTCVANGFSIAGLEAGNECWCSNSYSRLVTTKPASECATPCTGSSSVSCGGGWRLTTYKSGGAQPPPTTDWTLAHSCLVDSWTRVIADYSTVSESNSPAWCTAHCASLGYKLAGLEDGQECQCANAYNAAAGLVAAEGECTTPCRGDPTQTCGAGWRVAVYESPDFEVELPLPSGGNVITSCVKPNTVALTFDDGPHIWHRELADMFSAYGAKATFFLNGQNIGCIYDQTNIDNIKYAFAAGHEMASHSWNHVELTELDWDHLHDQMWKMEQALQRIVGVVPAYFRPPYGSYNTLVQDVARARGVDIVIWDFDSLDWQNAPAQVNSDYDSHFANRPNNVLSLNHEIHEHTVKDVMPYVLEKLTGLGYQLVTVSECLGTQAYQSVGSPGTNDGTWTC